MSCRGVQFAIEAGKLDRLIETDERDRVSFVQQELELPWDSNWLYETDQAWDAIHRCLTDGDLDPGDPSNPLSLAVLGNERLYFGDDYIIQLVRSQNVQSVADATAEITVDWIRERYFAIDPDEYGVSISEDDFNYTWHYFSGLPSFFRTAADAGRAILFTADQ